MAIDVDRALAAAPLTLTSRWGPDDVLLYNLGIGAGLRDASDPDELDYLLERRLKVLPSFAAIPVMPLIERYNDFPGIDVDPGSVLHGEHLLIVHRPLPESAQVGSQMRIARVLDKGSGAVVVAAIETSDTASGEPLCTQELSFFVRGEGGVGARDQSPRVAAPDRKADAVATVATAPNQAALYRLSGDRNPIHADPDAATAAGFPRPILHGLCTFGIACKAAVDHFLGGDPSLVQSFGVRFSGVVYPGESITVSMWEESDQIVLEAGVVARDAPVLRAGRMTTTKHRSSE
jgi:acyl dehydratase